MWILNAVLVHLFLLGSIFVIYFRSPVISGLQPQKSLIEQGFNPPANRVVIFVTDGLRAESFFRNNFNDVPHLHKLMQQTGVVGIAHTRVPTESRPGHIALLAGLYEDPSAVTRGWKENPIDFDTVFNRSAHTYAWGAHDILHIFSRLNKLDKTGEMLFDAYMDDLDFTGRNQTSTLDEWVFMRAKSLLNRKSKYLQQKQQVIFFLHLLGLDTAGHVHKPGSKLFLDNLHYTQQQIVEMYNLFETHFPDSKTAYILTSDHGMTDMGSHGAGGLHETETPFFIWGAGIAHKPIDMNNLPTLEQAQFATLISASIGSATPMNNFGVMPLHILNVSSEYLAQFTHNNALQLLAQFEALQHEHKRGYFAAYLRAYAALSAEQLLKYKAAMQLYFKQRYWQTALAESQHIMYAALAGIDYYQNYYRNALLLSTSITFIANIIYTLQLLLQDNKSYKSSSYSSKNTTIAIAFIAFVLLIFCVLQNMQILIAFYILLPLPVVYLALQNSIKLIAKKTYISQLLIMLACAELLVCAFFVRSVISICFLIYGGFFNFRQLQAQAKPCLKFYIWLFAFCALTLFPLLPTAVGKTNTTILLLGMMLTFARSILVKLKLSARNKLIYLFVILNALYCIYQHTNQMPINILNYIINWCFLCFAFLSIMLQTATLHDELKQRLELIVFNLTVLYALLSTAHELIFVLILCTELLLSFSKESFDISELQKTCQMALGILLYTYFSFFGTGNLATVSSFDPNIARCFLSKFAPFTIMTLVILKLALPVVLIVSIIIGINCISFEQQRRIFLWIMIICDVMGLNFLYLVRNQGSWLEIGTSISHFVILEATTLVLLFITILARCLLKLNLMENLNVKYK